MSWTLYDRAYESRYPDSVLAVTPADIIHCGPHRLRSHGTQISHLSFPFIQGDRHAKSA